MAVITPGDREIAALLREALNQLLPLREGAAGLGTEDAVNRLAETVAMIRQAAVAEALAIFRQNAVTEAAQEIAKDRPPSPSAKL